MPYAICLSQSIINDGFRNVFSALSLFKWVYNCPWAQNSMIMQKNLSPLVDTPFNLTRFGLFKRLRCLMLASSFDLTFFMATYSPLSVPRNTQPCAPEPSHCKSLRSSNGISMSSLPNCDSFSTRFVLKLVALWVHRLMKGRMQPNIPSNKFRFV